MSHCNCHEHSEPRHLQRVDSLQKSLQHIQPSTGIHLYCAMAKAGLQSLHEEVAVLAFIQHNNVLRVITMHGHGAYVLHMYVHVSAPASHVVSGAKCSCLT